MTRALIAHRWFDATRGFTLNEWWDGCMFESYHDRHRFVRLWAVWVCVHDLIGMLICVLIDHDIVDESMGTPEGGDIHLTCTRCSWGYRKILY